MSWVISEQIVKASGWSEEELLLEVVLLLFKQDKISLGKAAELWVISRYCPNPRNRVSSSISASVPFFRNIPGFFSPQFLLPRSMN